MGKVKVELDSVVHTELSELKARSGTKVRSLSQTVSLLLDFFNANN